MCHPGKKQLPIIQLSGHSKVASKLRNPDLLGNHMISTPWMSLNHEFPNEHKKRILGESALPRGFVAAVYDCRIERLPALIETPSQQPRGRALLYAR